MRICLVVEGSYPYVVGGVSSWVHSMIRAFPDREFVILAVVASRALRGRFVYELPENVKQVHEVYLDDADYTKRRLRPLRMDKTQFRALRGLLLDQNVDWETLINMAQAPGFSLNALLMGEDFLNAVKDCYRLNYSQMVFTDFLWMMRSIYLPFFFTLKMKVPKADLYHCVCTGYAGVLGSMAKYLHGGRLLISEHGIYTREREEELIKAKWVQGIYKNIWIEQFRKMSRLAYNRADLVTSLYERAQSLQIDLECPEEKTMVIPNGINVERYQNIPGKKPEDAGFINVGAVLRVTPIKDVKTMIQAFGFAYEREPKLKLWIMGPWDEDPEYAQQCRELVEIMGISESVIFTGRIDVAEYLGRMDMTILTSISEGQPLTILEGFAAKKPAIATDVGNCKGLILGESDDFGPAGVVTHVMNVEEIAQAIIFLAHREALRKEMGENGYRRVVSRYKIEDLRRAYEKLYNDLCQEPEEAPPVKAGKKRKWAG